MHHKLNWTLRLIYVSNLFLFYYLFENLTGMEKVLLISFHKTITEMWKFAYELFTLGKPPSLVRKLSINRDTHVFSCKNRKNGVK